MREDYFVNVAIESALKLYLKSKDNPESIKYNSFLVIVIRILVLIYGEADLYNPYYLNNKVAFLNNLGKYGMAKSDIAMFKEDLLNYFKFEVENVKRNIKQKNPYFTPVVKYLVDMFVLKKQNANVNYQEEEEFLELAYTSHTKNPYRVSYNYLNSDDALYIEKYYYSRLNSLDVTRDLSNTINFNLNLEALNYLGINLSNLNNYSQDELQSKQNNLYNYFSIDPLSHNRDEELQKNINYLKTFGHKKLSSGNGYVDILLLLSVIVTSFSIISIIILTF